MPFFYLSLMSSRMFHSKDIDGLWHALTEDPVETGAHREANAPHPVDPRGRPAARIVATQRIAART